MKRKGLREYERFLKKFRYRDALDASLRVRARKFFLGGRILFSECYSIQTGRADVVTSLLREMVLRDGLEIALGGRDEESLEPILLFLIRCRIDSRYLASSTAAAVLCPFFRYLVNPLYSQILCDVFSVLLGKLRLSRVSKLEGFVSCV